MGLCILKKDWVKSGYLSNGKQRVENRPLDDMGSLSRVNMGG